MKIPGMKMPGMKIPGTISCPSTDAFPDASMSSEERTEPFDLGIGNY